MCGTSAIGYGGLIYFAPLLVLAIPFLPLIGLVWGGSQVAKRVRAHSRRPEVLARRARRAESWQQLFEPKVLNAIAKEQQEQTNNKQQPLLVLLQQKQEQPQQDSSAAALSLLGFPVAALRRSSAAPSLLRALLASRAGDCEQALHVLLPARFRVEQGIWRVDLSCRSPECAAAGKQRSNVDIPFDINCPSCGQPVIDLELRLLGDVSILKQVAAKAHRASALPDQSRQLVAGLILYDAALSIASLVEKNPLWAQAFSSLLALADTLGAWDADIRGFSTSDLRGLCHYAAAALLGERTIAAVRSNPQRLKLMSKSRKFLKNEEMIEQAKQFTSEQQQQQQCPDEESLFEPWPETFKIELTVEAHSFKPKFFSKITFCDSCSEFVQSPLPNNGSACERCSFQKHPNCIETVFPCSVVINATPEDKRRIYHWVYRVKPLLLVWKRSCPQMPKDLVKMLHRMLDD